MRGDAARCGLVQMLQLVVFRSARQRHERMDGDAVQYGLRRRQLLDAWSNAFEQLVSSVALHISWHADIHMPSLLLFPANSRVFPLIFAYIHVPCSPPQMSSSLVWELTRTTSCKIVKRNGLMMSREKGNLNNKHSFRDSGLCNPKAVNIVATRATAKASKTPAMDLKNTKTEDARKPAKMWRRNHLKKGGRRASAAAAAVVGRYRPDLKKDAAKRMDKVLASLKVAHKPVKKGRRSAAL